MGWSEDQLKRASFTQTVRRILELKRSLRIYAEPELPDSQLEPFIDGWWRAKINGSFLLTLARLLKEGGVAHLQGHQIRVRRIIDSEAGFRSTKTSRRMIRSPSMRRWWQP